jgi:hypothetical protein
MAKTKKEAPAGEKLEEKLAAIKQKIENLLKENNAALLPVTIISGDKVVSRIDLVPLSADTNK